MIDLLLRLGFSPLQKCLAQLSGFYGICSRLQFRLFEEVAPALMAIRRTLASFQVFQCLIQGRLAFDDGDNTVRAVGSDVVANDGVGRAEFVACQRRSMRSLPQCEPAFGGLRFPVQIW